MVIMRIHIRVLVLVFALAAPTFQQKISSLVPKSPKSPCPSVFMYEPLGTEENRWYGVIYLTTDTTLNSLLLNIVVDKKADILGNWLGEATTQDNMNFKIENTDIKIKPGPATKVRFFVQFAALYGAPKLKVIRLNGREICNVDRPQPIIEIYDESRAFKVETTTKSRGWADIWPEDALKTRKSESLPRDGEINLIDYSKKPFTSSSSLSNNDVVFQNVSRSSNGNSEQITARATQAQQLPARILAPTPPNYNDDDDASYDESKDYFDGHPLIPLVDGRQ